MYYYIPQYIILYCRKVIQIGNNIFLNTKDNSSKVVNVIMKVYSYTIQLLFYLFIFIYLLFIYNIYLYLYLYLLDENYFYYYTPNTIINVYIINILWNTLYILYIILHIIYFIICNYYMVNI